MARFIKCAKEKITIPIKLIPTRFKDWIISDNSYFIHWFWHAKGDGPQEINKVPKPLGRNKIIVVILTLLKTFRPKDPIRGYSVTLNNLFIFTKLLIYLLAKGFGAYKTTRTNSGIH